MKLVKIVVLFLSGGAIGIFVLAVSLFVRFEHQFSGRVYPGIFADNLPLSGKTSSEIESYFLEKTQPLKSTQIALKHSGQTTIVSGEELNAHFDGELAATQTLSFGRTGSFSNKAFYKLRFFWNHLLGHDNSVQIASITSAFVYDKDAVAEQIETIANQTDIPAIEPQFEFDKNTKRVIAFKLGKEGIKVNQEKAKNEIKTIFEKTPGVVTEFTIPTDTIAPKTGDENIDNLGITELIGKGESFYKGSIPGRVHNVILASSRASGILVPPNGVFSFNETVGDISAATGYETAYIIKNGRTILGDGGGVCQVSTTIFRAALNAGLEIVERRAHSYRVAYYEQGGYKPGLDATVFYPTTDLKIKNNTDHHILIQALPDPENYELAFEIYGKSDGRNVELSDIKVGSISAAPPPLYQEDPTLAQGQIKQVDYAAGGAKTAFDYKVTRAGAVLGASTFVSNFKPWQAVFLYGPGTAVPTPAPPTQ